MHFEFIYMVIILKNSDFAILFTFCFDFADNVNEWEYKYCNSKAEKYLEELKADDRINQIISY